MAKPAKQEAPTIQGRAVPAPSPDDLDEFLAPVRREVEESLAEIRELPVTTPSELVVAAEMMKEYAKRGAIYDAKRKKWVEPLKSIASDIDAAFRPVLKGFAEGVEILKDKIGACTIALETQRSKLLKASTLAAGKKAEALQAQAAELIAPEVDGVGVKARWTGEVADVSKLPLEYMMPDLKKLEAVTEALGRDPEIPGWRAFITADVRTSRRG